MKTKRRPVSDRPYFFDGGLRFECTGCGQCCTGASGTIFVNDAEAAEIARALGMATDQFLAEYAYPYRGGHSLKERPNGDCIFLEGTRCRIYMVRPTQCRTFPFWPEILRNEKHWQETARSCEGIGRGKLYTREEILEQLNRALEQCGDAEW